MTLVSANAELGFFPAQFFAHYQPRLNGGMCNVARYSGRRTAGGS